VLPHEPSFIFPHLSGDLIHHLIDGDVHIIVLSTGLERDMVATVQNHLRRVTVFLDIQKYLYLDNFWIIKVKTSQATSAIFFHRFGDTDMPPGDLDGWVCILYLHIWALSFWVNDR
jgi:hypothetical protein